MMLVLNKKVTFREIEDSILIITPWDNSLHTLENVGCEIFKLLLKTKALEEIVEDITLHYQVDRETVLKDTKELIDELKHKKIFIEEV